jgi:hypothetical protein
MTARRAQKIFQVVVAGLNAEYVQKLVTVRRRGEARTGLKELNLRAAHEHLKYLSATAPLVHCLTANGPPVVMASSQTHTCAEYAVGIIFTNSSLNRMNVDECDDEAVDSIANSPIRLDHPVRAICIVSYIPPDRQPLTLFAGLDIQ